MNIVNFYPLQRVPKYLDAFIWRNNIKNYNKGMCKDGMGIRRE